MLLGVIPAIIICFITALLEMLILTDLEILSFFMNVSSSLFFVMPISIIHKKNKDKKNEYIILGLLLSSLSVALGMFILNIIITPIYLGVSLENTFSLLITTIVPFNLAKGIFNSIIIFLLYNPVKKILKKNNIFNEFEL